MKAYAIKDLNDEIIFDSIRLSEDLCKTEFSFQNWDFCENLGYRCVPVEITEASEVQYTLQDIIDAVQYGFDYRDLSQNNGKNVPNGNVLQWLMGKKNLKHVPEEFKKFKR